MKSLKHKLILIGASTGGPGHIEKIVKALPQDFAASLIIAQHMNALYLPSFTKSLNHTCALEVEMAKDGYYLKPSSLYVCSGYCTMTDTLRFSLQETATYRYNPDIDALFDSISHLSSQLEVLSVVLTGIGEDGAKGSLALLKSGATCLAEDEESAVVFGMPKRAAQMHPHILPTSLDDIIKKILIFGATHV